MLTDGCGNVMLEPQVMSCLNLSQQSLWLCLIQKIANDTMTTKASLLPARTSLVKKSSYVIHSI